jgi:transposase InsO family protein
MDLIEDLRMDEDGNQHILVLIDSFSRYLLLYPIKEKTAMAIARALLSMIGDYGAPKTLVSDRGPCFISDVLHELLQFIGTEHELTLAYSKEENGMVERANKETLRHLRNIIFDRSVLSKWSTYLPLVKRIFNASIHSVTGVAPAKIIYEESQEPHTQHGPNHRC